VVCEGCLDEVVGVEVMIEADVERALEHRSRGARVWKRALGSFEPMFRDERP
jgi:hypothetical protein